MERPFIKAYFQTASHLYELKNWQLQTERQRPAFAAFTSFEPVDLKARGMMSIGSDDLKNKAVLEVVKCDQKTPKEFQCEAIEPLRSILDAPYRKQEFRVSLEECLSKLAKSKGLGFKNYTIPSNLKPQNLIFLGSLRNALDQIKQIWGLQNQRFHIDLPSLTLFLTKGYVPGTPLEMPMQFFKEEIDGWVEFDLMPSMNPFVQLKWRSEKIVDAVRFSSQSQSMFIRMIDAATQ